MILDIRSIYTEYLNKANKANKKHDKIRTHALRLEQKLFISNEKREQAVSLIQQQTVKVKHYEKMINALQSLAFAQLDKFLSFIKSSID